MDKLNQFWHPEQVAEPNIGYCVMHAGLLGSWIYCCNSFLCSCRDVNWHHHSLILPGFGRAWDTTVCSSPSHCNSQWPKWDAKTDTRSLMKYFSALFSQWWLSTELKDLEFCLGAYFWHLSSVVTLVYIYYIMLDKSSPWWLAF